jgi:hypothetical protein
MENNMGTPEKARTVDECIEALALTGIKRPQGIVDWMHYGFALRYGGIRDHVEGETIWGQLEAAADNLARKRILKILPLLEERAWTVGSLLMRRLPAILWPELSAFARGRFLAGLARHMRRAASPESLDLLIGDQLSGASAPAVFDVVSEIRRKLPDASLDAESAAEIGANAIDSNRLDVLELVLAHRDFSADGHVSRISYPEQERFARQLSQHSTRLLDVLLEAAVRCHHPAAMRILLERGASPNIPCWNLERSYNDWFSALSFAIHALGRVKDNAQAWEMIDLLLAHGANAQGLECEGRHKPLMHAMQGNHWDLVDRLLEHGACFGGGRNYKPEDFKKERPLIPAGHPLIGYRQEDLDWVKQSIAPLVPLAEFWEIPLFYKGNAQGGWTTTFLHHVLADENLPLLKKYEAMGLPTTLTQSLIVDMVNAGHHDALLHLLRDNPNLPRVMFRIRRRKPDFGTSMRQLWLCTPNPDGSNVLQNFDPHGQTPLQLPDGSRVYAHLDCVAPPGHDHGPITEGCFWLEKITADYRRRRDHIVTRNIRRIWRMEPVPANNYQVPGMIPLVKEMGGRFFWLGINMGSLSFGEHVPPGWSSTINAWLEGEHGQYILLKFIERCKAQRAKNIELPEPVLSDDELKPYPREFWPFLRRLEDGTIGMTEESCRSKPDMLDIYGVWERQNKPDKDFQPDPRLLEWPMWPEVPVELRPYFYFDELFGKPSVTFSSRNAYEKEMIHKAVEWNNAWMIQSMKDAGII